MEPKPEIDSRYRQAPNFGISVDIASINSREFLYVFSTSVSESTLKKCHLKEPIFLAI
jgi:hypothetical protein